MSPLHGRGLTAAIAVCASTSFLLFGYDQGVMSGILTERIFEETFPETKIVTGSPQAGTQANVQGVTVAIYEIGALLGSVFVLCFGDRLGRKKCIAAGSMIMIIGAIIMTASYGLAQFIVGRIITGIGNGMNTSTVPMWQAELSKPHTRGALVMIEGALIAGGSMISYWIGFAFYFFQNSSVQWRFPIAFQIVPAAVIFGMIWFLPESPRWLIRRGRNEEALSILARLDSKPTDDPDLIAAMHEVTENVRLQSGGFSFKHLFTHGKGQHFRRAFIISSSSQMMQQLSGCNVIVYFASSLFENILGLGGWETRLMSACLGIVYTIAGLTSVFLVDRVGRRTLLLYGAAGMCFSWVILTICNYLTEVKGEAKAGIAAAVMLFVYDWFFGSSWLGLTWLIPAEMTPLRIRAEANAVATCTNWLFNFLVVMVTPPGQTSLGYKFYIIWAVFNASFIPIVYFLYPETKGRSLEEMDVIFAKAHTDGHNPVFVAKDMPRIQGNHLVDQMEHYFGAEAAKEIKGGKRAGGSPSDSEESSLNDATVEGRQTPNYNNTSVNNEKDMSARA